MQPSLWIKTHKGKHPHSTNYPIMKIFTIHCFLSTMLLFTNSCKEEDIVQATQSACSSQGKIVKTVQDLEGVVGFNSTLQEYSISRHQPGTYDVVEVGVLCGKVPDNIQIAGTKVLFSGTYKEYGVQPAAPVGYTYYYLDLVKVEIKKDQ